MGDFIDSTIDPFDLTRRKANKELAEDAMKHSEEMAARSAAQNVTTTSNVTDALKAQANDEDFLIKKKNAGKPSAAALSNQLGIT